MNRKALCKIIGGPIGAMNLKLHKIGGWSHLGRVTKHAITTEMITRPTAS